MLTERDIIDIISGWEFPDEEVIMKYFKENYDKQYDVDLVQELARTAEPQKLI